MCKTKTEFKFIMELNLDCIPCLQRQALKAIREISDDPKLQEQILREAIDTLTGCDWHKTPPELAHKIHKIVRDKTGGIDPYKKLKKESNDMVLEIYPELKAMVEESSDSVNEAIKLAIAGNIMDFGALDDFNIHKTIEYVRGKEINKENYKLFLNKFNSAKTLLLFADNAGEIVFDKLLIETLLSKKNFDKICFTNFNKISEFSKFHYFDKISYVIKGGSIINDATIEDAECVGIDKIENLIFLKTNNGDAGTGPIRNSPEVESWINSHDLVISKGQGNYEGLSGFNGIFYMLMAKCHIVAADLGVPVGSVVLRYK